MSALTIWIDETELGPKDDPIYIVGQLIVRATPEEFDFLKILRERRITARTWDTLHCPEFSKKDARKWTLLREWLEVFNNTNCYFHAQIFKPRDQWLKRYGKHGYWARQCCFGLGNKMRKNAPYAIQTMFSDVDTLVVCMDRRASTFPMNEGEQAGDLETIYGEEIRNTVAQQSKRNKETLSLRFSFARQC